MKEVLSPGIFGENFHFSLNEVQTIQARWENNILGGGITPANRIDRFLSEAIELAELLDGKPPEEFNQLCKENPAFRKAVAHEAIDTIILALSIIHSLGENADSLFAEKMEINFQKYSIAKMQSLLRQGHTREEAMKILKEEWNKVFPKDEFGNNQGVIYERK